MQKPLSDNTQHSKQTEIHTPVGFELAIPVSEWPQTHTLEGAATGIACYIDMSHFILPEEMFSLICQFLLQSNGVTNTQCVHLLFVQ